MSGHSKWGYHEAQEGGRRRQARKLFAKLIKNVEVAARSGGPDVTANPDVVRRGAESQTQLGAQ